MRRAIRPRPGTKAAETARRISFINALSGEARSTAITQLAHSTGRNEAQVERALARYNAATSVGTADGATAEAAREGTSVYGRTREAAGYDFAERSGKLDAQREVGTSGTRSAARIGEQRRQSENFGFAEGASAAGVSTRGAARLDSFIQALSRTAGNQVDMSEGGSAGIADRARNERITGIVAKERLTRMQGLLRSHGITMSKRDLALAQNGDLGLNLTPAQAEQFHSAGFINESQFGALANGGHARLSFADNDLLVSSSANFQQSARSDTSTRFEAGKQAGPDTIEHFLGGGAEGHRQMENWLRGGFEMDRNGNWRLKPQVADTLQRDVQAIMIQSGWSRSITRGAGHQMTQGTEVGGHISGGKSRGSRAPATADAAETPAGYSGSSAVQIGVSSTDMGNISTNVSATMDIVNYDVREAIARAERVSSKSHDPARAFSTELSRQILGPDGLRNRYLQQSSSGRGISDWSAPITSIEQRAILATGRHTDDSDHGFWDGDAEFKKR